MSLNKTTLRDAIEALSTHLPTVRGRRSSPPAAAKNGDRWIIDTPTPSDEWTGQGNKIAEFAGGSWTFVAAAIGNTFRSTEDAGYYSRTAAGWSAGGTSAAESAQKWANAVQSYAASVLPLSTTVVAAGIALNSALQAAFASTDRSATSAAMEVAFLAFAASVAGGMAPGFVGTPPAGAVGFEALFAPPYPATHLDAATGIANAIDAWIKTATATPSGGGAPVNWS